MSRIDEALRRANHAGSPPPEDPDLEPEPEAAIATAPELAVVATQAFTSAAEAEQPTAPASPASADEALWKARLNGKLVISAAIEPGAVEEFRKLAAALHQVNVARSTKVVMVASASAGEGKTLTAANLALTLSKSFGRRVLLVDTDLRRPMLHEVFGIANTSGLNDGLQARSETKLALIEVSPTLTVLPAGRPNPDPMSGLTSDRMRRILEEAAAKFEWVVLDTPPVGILPDAHLLAEMVDMVVLVVSAGKTPLRQIRRAVDALSRQRIVGVVLNGVGASAAVAYSRYASARDAVA